MVLLKCPEGRGHRPQQDAIEEREIEAEIGAAIEKLKTAPDNLRIKVADGIDVINSNLGSAFPILNSQEIDPRVLLKIGYEFLALNLGLTIFHQ